MKYSILLLSILAVSCGEYKTMGGASDRVGDIRQVTGQDAAASRLDRDNMVKVCNALARKESILMTALNSIHTFSTSQSDCDGNSIGSGNVNVVLQSGLSGFVFKRQSDGLDFIFPNVETADSGVLADICADISDLSNPVKGETEVTYFTTSAISSSDCAPSSGEICVKVEKAFFQGSTATIHTKEWLRVRVSSPDNKYIGFVTERKKVTQSFCGRNEALKFQASLQIK